MVYLSQEVVIVFGAITGSIAEAYYGVPKHLKETARKYLPVDLEKIVDDFEKIYPAKIVL